jgi:hypothetical protein
MLEKFTYWLSEVDFENLRSELAARSQPMYQVNKAVCVPLARKVKIGYIPPESWQKYKLCRRQLSWYAGSRFAGQYLVVSDFRLDDFGFFPNTIIRKSRFRPKELPGRKPEICRQLIERESYRRLAPAEWETFDAQEIEEQERRMAIMGVRGVDYRDIFLVHCANHANFLEPKYFLDERDVGKVPYAIEQTKRICSACLEFYNIIGEGFRKKLVVPCPGAVLFAGMGVNRYYEVETSQTGLK